jgi:hypothetical protein
MATLIHFQFPRTRQGADHAIAFLSANGIQATYPDGSTLAEIDWDAAAEQAELDWRSYTAWCRQNALGGAL